VLGTTDHALFIVGVLIVAAYVPLHMWRRFSDRRKPEAPAEPSLPVATEVEPELSV
jgi:hypothetical protein